MTYSDIQLFSCFSYVIQSGAKDLGNIHVNAHEILPPFGRLNDKSGASYNFISKST